jgi:aspartate aminotransferase
MSPKSCRSRSAWPNPAAPGQPVIVLGAGAPDFPTPEHVEAAARAMPAADTKYTPVDGTLALKGAIDAKFVAKNGLDFTPDQVIASTGGKQILFNAFMASLDPGDEVIVPAFY